MDSYDYKIIQALQRDGRMTNQALSEEICLSPSPCLKRLRDLERDGVIKGYTAIVDEEAYGLPITAFVRISLSSHSTKTIQGFEAAIQRIDEILDCYLVAGEADYLLRIIIESLPAYERVVRSQIQTLPGVASIDTSFTYGVVKRAKTFPVRTE